MSITVLVGLFFSIVAIKLVMTIENKQNLMIISGIYNIPGELVVSDTIGTHKLTLLKLTIRILLRVSMAIFCLQGIYPEIKPPLVITHSSIK
jgi:hypothetical protein